MKELPKISEAEYEIMRLIWDKHPISTNDVVANFENISDWSPKTVQTLLSRLVKKGAAGYEKKGRVFVYSPLIDEGEYVKSESRSFLKRFYNGALNSMVLSFVENGELSDDDITELERILDRAERKKNDVL